MINKKLLIVHVYVNICLILASIFCKNAADSCLRKGLLPLKVNGYQLATTLQNPYISFVPNSSLNTDESKRLTTQQLYKQAKSIISYNNYIENSLNDVFLLETNNASNLPEIPSSDDLKKAFNTFRFIFNDRKGPVKRLEESQRFCRWMSRGSIQNLKRKVHYLSYSSLNDPFFEYLGKIRNNIFQNE